MAQLQQGQGVAPVESVRTRARQSSSLWPSLCRRMLPNPCMAQAQAFPTAKHREANFDFHTGSLFFSSHFSISASLFFLNFFPPAVQGSCWQQQQLCFDELINISPRSEAAPACSASPVFYVLTNRVCRARGVFLI